MFEYRDMFHSLLHPIKLEAAMFEGLTEERLPRIKGEKRNGSMSRQQAFGRVTGKKKQKYQ